ncbi:MAG: hypothetical protein M1820_000744 [Bogoriella megaspora]|nr:MAG: hypothetical protein M1820_000744 [Bogoriella megaspora]
MIDFYALPAEIRNAIYDIAAKDLVSHLNLLSTSLQVRREFFSRCREHLTFSVSIDAKAQAAMFRSASTYVKVAVHEHVRNKPLFKITFDFTRKFVTWTDQQPLLIQSSLIAAPSFLSSSDWLRIAAIYRPQGNLARLGMELFLNCLRKTVYGVADTEIQFRIIADADSVYEELGTRIKQKMSRGSLPFVDNEYCMQDWRVIFSKRDVKKVQGQGDRIEEELTMSNSPGKEEFLGLEEAHMFNAGLGICLQRLKSTKEI